jgi:hypothetical protein
MGVQAWRVGHEHVNVLHHAEPHGFEFAGRGQVTVDTITPDSAVTGFVDLTFSDAGRFQGRFEATWMPWINRVCF